MLALSIRQPWLHFILRHGKRRENRTRQTAHRGLIYLHASSGCTDREYESAVAFAREQIGVTVPIPHWSELPLGALVATAELVDCVPNSEFDGDPWAFSTGYGYILANVTPLERPIPCAGKPWLFEVEDTSLPGPTPLRVVIGEGPEGCAAYRAAAARGAGLRLPDTGAEDE